jgi:DNA (cytosine-5)-methyltransferase 1
MSNKTIFAADLFCGAGGTSTGLLKACDDLGYKLNLLAVNHWDIAIATHSANHPYARHICENLDNVNPRKAVPSGALDILIASPECTHHSNARGGKPCSDQSRASGWHILRWAEALRIDNILIENVKEFQSWGPLGVNGRPLKSRKGETFQAFLNALTSLGYKVDFKVLNAAYYGDPTTRERLFIIARRGRRPIKWPDPTHTPDGAKTLFGKTKPWRTAREIIDWTIPGQSIFTRKKSLSQNTLNRIYAGLRKFSSKELEPFLVMLYGANDARSINRPMPTVTAQGGHVGVCEPFIVQFNRNSKPVSTNEPLPAQTTKEHFGVCRPFLVKYYGTNKFSSVEEPVPTLTTKDRFAVCSPFIMGVGGPKGSQNPRSIDRPLGTVVTEQHAALVQPFIIPTNHGKDKRSHSVDKPMPTITSVDAWGVIQPFVLGQQSCAAPRSVDKPIPTVASAGAIALVQPKIDGHVLDIHFRMLKPHELARAMSFGDDYKFEGNREAQVKQIGNAVPVMLAKELCKALLN